VLIESGNGALIPLSEVAEVRYRRGPQAIKSEDAQLVTYVMFDKAAGESEVDVVEQVREDLQGAIDRGTLEWRQGVTFSFAGNFENAERARQRLQWLIPIVLIVILVLLYLQFRSLWTVGMIFSSVVVSLSAGFILLWLYGQPWFLNFELFGIAPRSVFQVEATALSVAVWVGFIALFGIATDDGVVMATRLKQTFDRNQPESLEEILDAVVEAGVLRSRACVMTTSTTILALLPVLTSYGAGSNIMVPMAIPIIGGMTVELLTLFVVPALYSVSRELQAPGSDSTNGEDT
jgi:Cu(I)/Ag(I) efflux system membrane protein CusA/SilA